MSAHERETVITFSDGDKTARITTHQRRIITKLRRNPAFKVASEGVFDGTEWVDGTMPAEFVSFRRPREKRELTEEQRQAAAERLRAARTR